MDAADLHPLVDDVSSNLDDLEEALAPLLQTGLSHSTSKLPLLDKAKAYVLTTYAIESVLFSYLRLNGVDTKQHPISAELARVKTYFGKIKAAEMAGAKRSSTLDKEAASRFIRHGLAGNERFDRERAERMAGEKAGAKRELEDLQVGTHTRFDGAAKRMRVDEGEQSGSPAVEQQTSYGTDGGNTALLGDGRREWQSPTTPLASDKKARKLQRRLARRLAKLQAEEGAAAVGEEKENEQESARSQRTAQVVHEEMEGVATGSEHTTTSKKKRKRRKDKAKKLEDERAEEMK